LTFSSRYPRLFVFELCLHPKKQYRFYQKLVLHNNTRVSLVFFSIKKNILGILNVYLSKVPPLTAQNLKLNYLLCSDTIIITNNYESDNISRCCHSPRQVEYDKYKITFT